MPGGYHFFWKTGSPFSQWHRSNYSLDGYQYSTAEQGMMHGKALLFRDVETADKILKTNDPRKIKELGRQVKGFSEKEWKKHREAIVYKNSVAKFTQNEHLKAALLATTGLLVEASPSDKVWGIGMHENDAKRIPENKWKGLNLLGKILTRVRDEIKLNAPPGADDGEANPKKPARASGGEKIVYMIRHGQSEGQTATRRDRKNSSALRDCDLTRKGRKEAEGVSRMISREELDSIELVVSSPLTRALHTSLLAFPTKDVIVNFDLGELGTDIPENTPRKMEDVLSDMWRGPLAYRNGDLLLDTTSMQPVGWPEIGTNDQQKTNEKIKKAFQWLAKTRDETTIAVVCHYNVIRTAVADGGSLKPANGAPIRCRLRPDGELVLG